MGPHADIDSRLHLRRQRPHLLVVLLQGFLIELRTQKASSYLEVTGLVKRHIDIYIFFQTISSLGQVLIIIFKEWIRLSGKEEKSDNCKAPAGETGLNSID